jgi:hypothetical protein
MRSPPGQVLVLHLSGVTVLVGPPRQPGLGQIHALTVLASHRQGPADATARHLLHAIPGDPAQMASLRAYLVALNVPGSVGPRTDATIVSALLDALHTGRLGAVMLETASARAYIGLDPAPTPRIAMTARAVGPARADPGSWSTSRKLEVWFERIIPLLPAALGKQVLGLLTPRNLELLVAGIVLLAGLQAVGVGEAADAVFAAIAYAAAGWQGLVALVHLVEAAHEAATASTDKTLDDAARKGALALTTLGMAFLSAVLVRMAKRNTSGGGTAPADEAAEAKPQTVNRQRGQGVGSKTPAKVPAGPPNYDFESKRPGGLDMNNLSPADTEARDQLKAGGWPDTTIVDVLKSGDNFSTTNLTAGDKLYGFGSDGYGLNSNSPYWLDQPGYDDVASKYIDPENGDLDSAGIKQYLALPCFNQANTIDQGTVASSQAAPQAIIGPAQETVTQAWTDGSTTSFQQFMTGGGTQISPAANSFGDVIRLKGAGP